MDKPKRGRGRPPLPAKRGYHHLARPPALPPIAAEVDAEALEVSGQERAYSDWKKLKWMRFVEAYIQCGVAKEAYKLAGYMPANEQSASSGASRLLAQPWVQIYLKKRLAEIDWEEEYGGTRSTAHTIPVLTEGDKASLKADDDEIIFFFTSVLRDTTCTLKQRHDAAVQLAKIRGLYEDKEEAVPEDTAKAIRDALGLGDE
jgi:hypothetical protein